MSLEATSWAFALDDQRLTPVMKLVLLSIADAAFEDHQFECAVRHETIARKSHVSVDTVQRRVKDLVALGYLHVVTRRGADGRQIANSYCVLVNDAAKRHAAAHGWAGHVATEQRSEERTETVENGAAGPQIAARSEGVSGPQGTRSRAAGYTEPGRTVAVAEQTLTDSNRSPPTPPWGEGEGAKASLSEKTDADGARFERWEAFRKLWPWDATELPGEARVAFMALTDAEQALAVAAAPAYAAACKTRATRARNHGMAHAKKWLANEGWITARARSVESAAALGGAPYTVRKGSPQAAAWAEYETRIYGAPRLRYFESKQLGLICVRPSEWPPRLAGQQARDGPDHAA